MRSWRTLVLVISIIALATTILVSAALGPASEDADREDVMLDEATAADKFVEEAQVAILDGDTGRAIELLEQALVLDPSNSTAQSLLDSIPASMDDEYPVPTSDEQDDGTSTGPDSYDETPFLESVEDLAIFLPTGLAGMDFGQVVCEGADAQVIVEPIGRSPVSLQRAVLAVHDRGTVEEAAAFTDSVSRVLFPEDASETEIFGATVYFGTDGGQIATATFVRGRYVFEILLTSNAYSATNLEDTGIIFAEACPTRF